MRRLSTMLLLSVFGLSTLSNADQKTNDCIVALDAADGLIKKQDDLIQKLSKVVEQKQTQDDELSKALVKMKEASDVQLNTNITVGAVGVVVGVLIMGFVKK